MFNKKFFTILSILVGVIVVGAIAVVWVDLTRNDVNDNMMGKVENGLEVDTSDWQIYRNEEFRFSFKYPENFYLLNRLGERENSILISDEEITFNEFLNGYFAPITISPSNKKNDNEYINSILNKEEQKIIVGGIEGLKLNGIFPEQPPYREFNTIVIIFNDPSIIIKASDVRTFAGGKINFDLEQFLDNFLMTIKFED